MAIDFSYLVLNPMFSVVTMLFYFCVNYPFFSSVLTSRGVKEVLQKRLKNHIKKEKLVQAKLAQEKRMNEVHFYCVIDFEGTCEEENPKDYIHEIIEFPAVLVDATTLEVVSEISRGTKQLFPANICSGKQILPIIKCHLFYWLCA